jgi:hypothetical protein
MNVMVLILLLAQTSYDITWTPGVVDQTHPAAQSFRVYGDGKLIGSTPGNVFIYTESVTLAPGTDRCWRVTAVAGGEGPPSNSVCASSLTVVTYPTVPPLKEIAVSLAPVIWTLGAPSKKYPGNFEVLRSGQSVHGALASQIALCIGIIHIFARDKLWWRYTGTGWLSTNSPNLSCDPP